MTLDFSGNVDRLHSDWQPFHWESFTLYEDRRRWRLHFRDQTDDYSWIHPNCSNHRRPRRLPRRMEAPESRRICLCRNVRTQQEMAQKWTKEEKDRKIVDPKETVLKVESKGLGLELTNPIGKIDGRCAFNSRTTHVNFSSWSVFWGSRSLSEFPHVPNNSDEAVRFSKTGKAWEVAWVWVEL